MLPEEFSRDSLLPGWRDRGDAADISAAYEAGLAMSAEQAVTCALADAAD